MDHTIHANKLLKRLNFINVNIGSHYHIPCDADCLQWKAFYLQLHAIYVVSWKTFSSVDLWLKREILAENLLQLEAKFIKTKSNVYLRCSRNMMAKCVNSI